MDIIGTRGILAKTPTAEALLFREYERSLKLSFADYLRSSKPNINNLTNGKKDECNDILEITRATYYGELPM